MKLACPPTRKKQNIKINLPISPSLFVFVQACIGTIICVCVEPHFEPELRKDVSVYRCGYPSDCPDSCGSTPLMDALRTGHVLVAETLIKEHKVQKCNMKA